MVSKIKQYGLLLFFGAFTLITFLVTMLYGTINFQNSAEDSSKILMVLDVSESMNARDMPMDRSRLDAAKEYIINLMGSQPGHAVGIDIFAGSYQKILPFSSDIGLVSTFLSGVNSSSIYENGSNLQQALRESIDSQQDITVIYLTDGPEEEINIPIMLKNEIQQKNISIFTVGFGTLKGAYIPVNHPVRPYKTYNGQPVITRLAEKNLEHITSELGGTYMRSETDIPLGSVGVKNHNTWIQALLFTQMILLIAGYLFIFYVRKYAK